MRSFKEVIKGDKTIYQGGFEKYVLCSYTSKLVSPVNIPDNNSRLCKYSMPGSTSIK